MWSPTHVQVTVQKVKGLTSGKGTNGVFVTIGLGKEKYQTSIKQRESSSDQVEWREKCELQIPKHGNTASIVLTTLSQNFLGVDQFLGCIHIPLTDLDVYERPKNKFYDLCDKHGKAKTKERGQLEVKIGFSVKPGSLNDISNKKADYVGSLGHLAATRFASSNVGGSLASINSVDKKSLKNLAKSFTRRINSSSSKPKDKQKLQLSYIPDVTRSELNPALVSRQAVANGDADPGVISDDEFAFDDLSHTGSGCSLEINNILDTGSIETVASGDMPQSSLGKEAGHGDSMYNTLPPSKPPRSVTPIEKYAQKWEQKYQEAKKIKAMLNKSNERIVVGGETRANNSDASLSFSSKLSPELLLKFSDKTKEELIEMVYNLQSKVRHLEKEKAELEDYIDNLLFKVIEKSPEILQNPFH